MCPVYDYYCEANGITIEVMQLMKDEPLKTWGQLCKAKDMDPGKTPKNSPVKKQLSAHGKHVSWSQWKALN